MIRIHGTDGFQGRAAVRADFAGRKIHDPEGIQWCIPKTMEKEYSRAIKRGERCYRGAIGKYALNIGKSYAIHGTSNPRSIGKRVSHGCVRTYNRDIKQIYQLMDVGDKVYIVDDRNSQVTASN